MSTATKPIREEKMKSISVYSHDYFHTFELRQERYSIQHHGFSLVDIYVCDSRLGKFAI